MEPPQNPAPPPVPPADSPVDAAIAREARERRTQRAFAGWLASRTRAAALEGRRATPGKD
jgi:hypothetical protein